MKIKRLKVIHCDAGWRPWTFLKIATDAGIDGWSECSESNGSPQGIAAVLAEFEPLLVGSDPCEVERIYWLLYSRTRQSAGGVIQKAIAAVENALLDIKAKSFGVPVCDLLGGRLRDRLPVYWSHCGTTRVRAASLVGKPAVRCYEDLDPLCDEILESGCSAIKTNICLPAKDGGLVCLYARLCKDFWRTGTEYVTGNLEKSARVGGCLWRAARRKSARGRGFELQFSRVGAPGACARVERRRTCVA